MIIVLAHVATGRRVVKEGQWDIGGQHTWEEYQYGEAVMWLNDGTEEDKAKAEAFVVGEKADSMGVLGWSVFCYPATELNPLVRARAEVMRIGQLTP